MWSPMDLEWGRSNRGSVPLLVVCLELEGDPTGCPTLPLLPEAPLTAARAPLVRRVLLLGRPMPTAAEGDAACDAAAAVPPLPVAANRDGTACFGDAADAAAAAARDPAPLMPNPHSGDAE